MDGYRKFTELRTAHNAFRHELQYYLQYYFNSTLRCFWCCSGHIDFLWNWFLLKPFFLFQGQKRILVCNQINKSIFSLYFFIPSQMTRTGLFTNNFQKILLLDFTFTNLVDHKSKHMFKWQYLSVVSAKHNYKPYSPRFYWKNIILNITSVIIVDMSKRVNHFGWRKHIIYRSMNLTQEWSCVIIGSEM